MRGPHIDVRIGLSASESLGSRRGQTQLCTMHDIARVLERRCAAVDGLGVDRDQLLGETGLPPNRCLAALALRS